MSITKKVSTILLALLLSSVLLTGCATNTVGLNSAAAEDSAIELNPDQVTDEAVAQQIAEPDPPTLDLDSDTLANLLVVNLASYQGQWGVAAKHAQQTAMATQDYRLARLATLLALRNNDYDTGKSSAQLWYDLNSDAADPLNMLMITQLGSGDLEGVKKSIALHAEGKELDSHIKQVAALLMRQKNRDAGMAAAEYLVETYADSGQAALSSAFVAEYFEDFNKADQWIAKALSIQPGWELAAQMRAKILASQDKMDERGQFIREYVQSHPDSIIMRINLAAEMLRNDDADGAYAYMQTVLDDAPRDVDAINYAGALAEDRKDYKQATAYYRRALNIDPGNDDVRWSLARRYLIDKNYKQAERHFDDITDPDMIFDARIQVANARYELYGLRPALNTLAGLDPRSNAQWVSLTLNRHYLLMSDYQYEEALGAINEVLYYLPDNLDLIYARALVAAELKRLDIAEPDLRSIIKANPEHANALNALGYTLADQTDRLEEARELIEKALALRPNDAHILDSMGWVAYKQKDFDTALEYLQKAYKESEEVEIATHLAEVLWEMGEQEKAKEIWLSWSEKEGDNRLLKKTMQRYGVIAGQSKASEVGLTGS